MIFLKQNFRHSLNEIPAGATRCSFASWLKERAQTMAPSGLDFNLRAFLKTYFIVVHYNGKEEPFGEDFSQK